MTTTPSRAPRPAVAPAERRALRPIFVGGCPRSGTTLLGALLGAHSRCVCVPEMPFKFDLLYGVDWNAPEPSWREIRRTIEHLGSFRMWGVDPAFLTNAHGRREARYQWVIDELVRRYAAAAGRADADVWVEHIPHNIRHVRALLREFPDAVVLHLVRDGRGVAASLLPVGWGAGTERAAAGYWAEHLAYGFAAERLAPDRVHRVHYESLLRDPHDEVTRLSRLAGLEEEPQLGRETRFPIPRGTLAQHARVATPPDPSRADSWRSALQERQIETFEYQAGELLESLGYELVFGGRARPPSMGYRMRLELRELAWDVRRLGWKGLLEVKHRLDIGRPDAF
jgi:hypothetical protein